MSPSPLHIVSPNENYSNDANPSDMTFSRRAARYLSRYSWYNPQAQATDTNKPSLDAAWSHYEHVTLPRRFADKDTYNDTLLDQNNNNNNNNNSNNASFVRAPQSQRLSHNTRLYPVWLTPLSELVHFGVSLRMFFSTLLLFSGILFLAGLLNIPLMIYFWNYAPSEDGANQKKDGVDYMWIGKSIRASALCDASEWVECNNCDQYKDEFPSYRLTVMNGVNLVRRNTCNFEGFLAPGLISFAATILMLMLAALFFFGKQRQAEIVFDEQIQTASDYSIKVSNPPKDALDPEEWRHFFNQFIDANDCAEVVLESVEKDIDNVMGPEPATTKARSGGVCLVTIAIDNADLVRTLILRRKKLEILSKLVSYGPRKLTNMTPVERAVADASVELSSSVTSRLRLGLKNICLQPREPALLQSEIVAMENSIREMVQRQYHAVSVFVTFDTERSQRNALHALSTGKLNIWRNQLNHFRSKLQKGGRLKVRESFRNSSLWDLTSPVLEHRTIQLATSAASNESCSRCLLFRRERVLRVKEANEPSDVRWVDLQTSPRQRIELHLASAAGMTMFVMWSGYFIYRLTESYPVHYATIFITLTNAIVPTVCELINDLESHPTEHGKQISLYVKMTLFRWFNSAIALSVISTFIETISVEDGNEFLHQSLMYRVYPVIVAELFCNPLIELLDPLENLRKHFLAPRAKDQAEMNACFTGGRFWLAERYTNAMKVLFVALFFSSILPESLFLGSLALLAQYYVGKFSLFRLCGPPPHIGFHLSRLSRNYFIPTILVTHVVMSAYWWSGYPYDSVCESDSESEGGYSYCNQNFFGSRIFLPLPRFQPEGAKWMTESQETLTSLYGWTSVVVMVIAFYAFIRNNVIPFFRSLYESTYEPDGMEQGIDFSEVTHLDEVHGYIPQVKVKGILFPFLACNIDGIDEDLIGWKDKEKGYISHSLVHDLDTITDCKTLHPVFSIVQQWNPNPPQT